MVQARGKTHATVNRRSRARHGVVQPAGLASMRISRTSPGRSDGGKTLDAFSAVVAGIVGSVLLFVAVVILQGAFRDTGDGTADSRIAGGGASLASRLHAEQREAISSYRWVDRSGGVVAIPIDRALELTVRELRVGSPSEGGKHPANG